MARIAPERPLRLLRFYKKASPGKLLCVSSLIGSLFILSGCALLFPQPETSLEQLKPGQYSLDPSHATVLFKVSHLGLSTFVGRFNGLKAELDFAPEVMRSTRLEARIETASVDVNNRQLEDMLTGRAWFNSEQHPHAIFVTRYVTETGDGTFLFGGDLTLNGISAEISLEGRFSGGAYNALTRRYTLGFEAYGQINRTDFGIDKYTQLVGEVVELEVYAEFLRN